MNVVGTILFALGMLLTLGAFGSETAVGSTINIGLLQDQMMLLHTGLASVIVGALFIGLAPQRRNAHSDKRADEDTHVTAFSSELEYRRPVIIAGIVVAILVVGSIAYFVLAQSTPNNVASTADVSDENVAELLEAEANRIDDEIGADELEAEMELMEAEIMGTE